MKRKHTQKPVRAKERVRMMWCERMRDSEYPHSSETIVNLLIHYILTLLLIKKRISLNIVLH